MILITCIQVEGANKYWFISYMPGSKSCTWSVTSAAIYRYSHKTDVKIWIKEMIIQVLASGTLHEYLDFIVTWYRGWNILDN